MSRGGAVGTSSAVLPDRAKHRAGGAGRVARLTLRGVELPAAIDGGLAGLAGYQKIAARVVGLQLNDTVAAVRCDHLAQLWRIPEWINLRLVERLVAGHFRIVSRALIGAGSDGIALWDGRVGTTSVRALDVGLLLGSEMVRERIGFGCHAQLINRINFLVR